MSGAKRLEDKERNTHNLKQQRQKQEDNKRGQDRTGKDRIPLAAGFSLTCIGLPGDGASGIFSDSVSASFSKIVRHPSLGENKNAKKEFVHLEKKQI